MPYRISKLGNCYRVINVNTGKIMAKCTSSENALAQIRLLEMIERYKVKPK